MINTDILMVNPKGLGSDGFPFGISILAAILQKENFSVKVVDADANWLNPADAVKQIINANPQIVCFTGLWKHLSFILEISKLLRSKFPLIKQIGGGWWASPIPNFVLRESCLDYVVRGEADLVITNLCQKLLNRNSVFNMPGLSYLNDRNEYIENKSLPCPSNLDKLPLPAYELFNMKFYIGEFDENLLVRSPFYNREVLYKRFGKRHIFRSCSLYSGRGCYGSCKFCSAAGLLRRNHSPKYVVDHMEKMNKEFGVDFFFFNESLTLSVKEWVEDFCHEIISRELNILYSPQCRGDFHYNDKTFKLLSESGCYDVLIGFESGSNELLKNMNKKVSLEQYYKIVDAFHRYRIAVMGSFVLNMPGETEKSLKDTITFVKNSKIYRIGCGFASPLPGTELYCWAKENHFIKNERRFLLENPARDKGRHNFKEYMGMFNFNNIASKKLYHTKKVLDRFNFINGFYYRSKVLYWMFRMFFPLTSLVRVVRFFNRGIHSLIRNGPRRFIERILKKLRRI